MTALSIYYNVIVLALQPFCHDYRGKLRLMSTEDSGQHWSLMEEVLLVCLLLLKEVGFIFKSCFAFLLLLLLLFSFLLLGKYFFLEFF